MPECPSDPFPFALVPAAGRSRRMGAPKLLLDVGGKTVIARLLLALRQAGLSRPLVIVDPADEALRSEIEREGGRAVVAPSSPPDMRSSVAVGLEAVGAELLATGAVALAEDLWMLIPADHPLVLPETVAALLAAGREHPGRIVVPTFHSRRGHPTVFTWRHALEVKDIPQDEGLNWILKRHAGEVLEIPVPTPTVLLDLDTPADYERLLSLWK